MDKMPLTVRRSIEVLGLIGVGWILVTGKDIIMPIIMAAFLALMLMPVYRWLRARHLPDVVAILLSVVLLIVVIAGIGILLSTQVAGLVDDFPKMKQTLNQHWNGITSWVADRWHVPIKKQMSVINTQLNNLGSNMAGTLQSTAASLTNVFLFLGLIPIYIFLILFYKDLLGQFIFRWFGPQNRSSVTTSFQEIQVMVKYYLVGLLIQITYLTVMLSVILMLFGIKHALLIGITFAVLNLIPYVGALFAIIFGVLLTITSSPDLWQVWAVLGTIAFVQFLDNNILMPRIVGSKVKINSLASIVGIFMGGALAGISGMFLSIPIMAILKIVFDKSPTLSHWGLLLGEPEPTTKNQAQTAIGKERDELAHERDKEIEGNLD